MGDSLEGPLDGAKMWQALELAQAKDFVEAMKGLAEHVAQGGTNFLGGQRQRSLLPSAMQAGNLDLRRFLLP